MKQCINQVILAVVQSLVQVVPDMLFQQDNSHSQLAWRTFNSVDMLPYLAASTDLCPIEHVWTSSDMSCTGHRTPPAPVYLEKLRAAVDASWQGVTQVAINCLINSIPHRLVAYIARRGGHIYYWINNFFCISFFCLFNHSLVSLLAQRFSHGYSHSFMVLQFCFG